MKRMSLVAVAALFVAGAQLHAQAPQQQKKADSSHNKPAATAPKAAPTQAPAAAPAATPAAAPVQASKPDSGSKAKKSTKKSSKPAPKKDTTGTKKP